MENEAGKCGYGADGGKAVDIVVLFTSDVHCGVDKGWGFAGLQQIKNTLEAKGDQVLLVDDGDAIQGEPIGIFSSGKAVADLMGKAGYDAAIWKIYKIYIIKKINKFEENFR